MVAVLNSDHTYARPSRLNLRAGICALLLGVFACPVPGTEPGAEATKLDGMWLEVPRADA